MIVNHGIGDTTATKLDSNVVELDTLDTGDLPLVD